MARGDRPRRKARMLENVTYGGTTLNKDSEFVVEENSTCDDDIRRIISYGFVGRNGEKAIDVPQLIVSDWAVEKKIQFFY